jgi:hypothetical protein
MRYGLNNERYSLRKIFMALLFKDGGNFVKAAVEHFSIAFLNVVASNVVAVLGDFHVLAIERDFLARFQNDGDFGFE